MKRFLTVLLAVLFIAGCSPRWEEPEGEQSPTIDGGTIVPTGSDGIYQGEKLPFTNEAPLQIEIVKPSQIKESHEYANLYQGEDALTLRISSKGNIETLFIIEKRYNESSGEEYSFFLHDFWENPDRKEVFITLPDFQQGGEIFALKYKVDGVEGQRFLCKNEAGDIVLARNRQDITSVYWDQADVRLFLSDRLGYAPAHDATVILQWEPYELWYEPLTGELTIFDGSALRYYNLNRLFEVENPDEVWGGCHAMIQNGRLTFLVQYQNEIQQVEVGSYGETYQKTDSGVRNFAASFDLSTGNCTAVEKLKRGKIAFAETDGDMLYLCHTDVDESTGLYRWDVASFSTSAFVFVNTAGGSFAGDQLLSLTEMELLPGGSIELAGLDAYEPGKGVSLVVDLKKGAYTRSPEIQPLEPDEPHRPLLLCWHYQSGAGGMAADFSERYWFHPDGTFSWLPSNMGYSEAEYAPLITAKGGNWRLEGNDLILTTMIVSEIRDGVLQEPGASHGWYWSGEETIRLLSPGEYTFEILPIQILQPGGYQILIDGQLYSAIYYDERTLDLLEELSSQIGGQRLVEPQA